MRNLTDFAFRLEYERIKDLGDTLIDIGGRLNGKASDPRLKLCTETIPNAAADRIDATCNVQVVVNSTALQPLR